MAYPDVLALAKVNNYGCVLASFSVVAQCRLPTHLATHVQTWAGKFRGGAAGDSGQEKIGSLQFFIHSYITPRNRVVYT